MNRTALLTPAGALRQALQGELRNMVVSGEIHTASMALIRAIDDLAAALTGDRSHLVDSTSGSPMP